jgi:hypothetical protein
MYTVFIVYTGGMYMVFMVYTGGMYTNVGIHWRNVYGMYVCMLYTGGMYLLVMYICMVFTGGIYTNVGMHTQAEFIPMLVYVHRRNLYQCWYTYTGRIRPITPLA